MLLHAHSGLRWVLLVFIIGAIVISWLDWLKEKPYPTQKWPLMAMATSHTQLVLGLVLYLISPKSMIVSPVSSMGEVMGNSMLRFYNVEHTLGMILAIYLLSRGHLKAKARHEKLLKDKKKPDAEGHKIVLIHFAIALLIILVSIPWPFRNLGAGWF